MNSIMAMVGQHTIKIRSDSEYLLKFINELFPIGRNRHIDLVLTLQDGYGAPFIDFDVEITKDNKGITYHRTDYLIEVDLDFKNATVSIHDNFALKHALMNLYSAFILHHNWGLLLHSSCAIENEKAHVFSGKSGAGKSTAARLSAPRELLADEASIIKITSNEILVYNSPFRSELEATGLNEPKHLVSIQLLNQALQNKRVRLKRSDALIQLMDKVFYWAHSPDEATRIFGLLKQLVENVPVYDLHFQKNNRFWELISS